MAFLKLILLLTLSFDLYARSFIVVGFSGYKTKRDGKGESSGAHENLPKYNYKIKEHYTLVHYSKKSELQDVIDEFDCQDGNQGEEDLGLIIMSNSWGAKKAYKLARMYKQQCSRSVDFAVIVDAVKKPIGKYKKKFAANSCVNYYQTKGPVRGGPIKNCQNIDLTSICGEKPKSFQCHVEVEWEGTSRGYSKILDYIRLN